MKRDLNLVREILLWMERQEHANVGSLPEFADYSGEQVGYHAYLAHEAGLIVAAVRETMGQPSPEAIPLHLTFAGHDFLDAARDNTLWAKARNRVLSAGVSFTLDLLKEFLVQAARAPLGLS